MIVLELLSAFLICLGIFFFFASAVGLLRFPDTLCRMHALAKADNLALGCVIMGAMLRQTDLYAVGKLLLIWVVTLLSSATGGFLLAQRIRRKNLALERDI
ncbi:MAG: monovalent cation/H(+) antiporter subunit G [Verrucomicrobia bacterium]|nr:monovalent cation/H(+) antiporter subunit G [Verrucomicrobiota bacterium]MCH8511138.1 monovalent cation/H(+) antiporter subunit G [Kiritimatiellia bacterium]